MAVNFPELTGETDSIFSLSEICERCGVHAEFITEMIEFGVIAPVESTHARWQFNTTTLVRIRRAQRLQRDLDLNLPGLALSLDLLDEIESLKQEISLLRHRLQRLHE